MGPPGSGKGTISSRIVKNFNLSYLASGDILRSHISRNTDKGKEAKKFIERGQLVPDELVTNLILEQLYSLSKCSWLLDGFPRTVKQAKDLTEKHSITLAINLAVPDEVIISRLKGRWLHPASGRIYNTDFNPPKVHGIDDVTGEKLIQREDDKPDIVLARLLHYKEGNTPVLEYYRKKSILREFSGKESNEIWPRVKLCLEELFRENKNRM
ncbi:GTP:AMP phosphotransferase AK3, mitochondrial [Trichonephila inaurata madagascariensis]|uniref:GTP:AMP phosphotransferase, mitochondrial n=1 Tax=Trichonephila inaurata madagascariensis TaxID=2747483 RepID=A0A8X6YUR5_9ARAC|nr:GTP:AMP phosphotransferase AK3, mitochondrial [Trichonephila inaurata madagascariensis]